MAKDTILIIEDDPDIVELVQYNLEREGYKVRTARDGESGLQEARRRKPGLILLDLMMPGMDGLEVCRALKRDEQTAGVPVLMVTAKGEESDVVLGLEMGADDYVTKPFSPRELTARIRAVLRRGKAPVQKTRIELHGVSIDSDRFECHVEGELVPLTRAEFRLLWRLASYPGRVYSREELVDGITAGETLILERNVDVHVSSIRKKLGSSSDLIATVRGVGYKCRD
ncbi:MAG: response regulator transcription factor [bacterium]|nr:response regulator transcription factor [bacterium]